MNRDTASRLIWMVMSLAVIPLLVHRPPAISIRWWIQLIGHIPFVRRKLVAVFGCMLNIPWLPLDPSGNTHPAHG
jgi:hypothetical protein